MDKELKVIDGIVNNLAGIQSFYEFECEHLDGLVKLLRKFQAETSSASELVDGCEMFEADTGREIEELQKRLQYASKRVDQVKGEIRTRLESKGKLLQLFESLKSVEAMEGEKKGKGDRENEDGEGELPVMEIREELDDDGMVLRSEVKPYRSKEAELRELMMKKREEDVSEDDDDGVVVQNSFRFLGKKEEKKGESETKGKEEKEVLEDNGEFRPFVIREEIDEDGNLVKSSMSRIPQMESGGADGQDEDVDEDQITELFEDMGLNEKAEKVEKVEEVEEEVDEEEEKPEIASKFNIATNDLYTLELLADEMNENDEGDGGVDDDGDIVIDDIDEYEWPVIDGEGDDDDGADVDDDADVDDEIVQEQTLEKMFGARGKSLFAQQIMQLRGKSVSSSDKKSVSFDERVEVKEVPDIWDDVRASEREAEVERKTSLFRRSMGRGKVSPGFAGASAVSDAAVGDVVERQVVEVVRPALKTNLRSLQRNGGGGVKIEPPREANPVTSQAIADEDYEIVRREVEEEEMGGVEVEEEEEEEEGVVGDEMESIPTTSIDYANLGEDLDTMAKAYVMGLYDEGDLVHGPVIEELDDFAKHNAVVEADEEVKVQPEDEDEVEVEDDNQPMLADIVEQDMDVVRAQNAVVDDMDIVVHDDELAAEVALAYAARRRDKLQLIDSEEGEFVPRDDAPRVSRFKAMRR